MPGTTPPDPWKLYIDLYDNVTTAAGENLATVIAVLETEDSMVDQARSVEAAIVEEFGGE